MIESIDWPDCIGMRRSLALNKDFQFLNIAKHLALHIPHHSSVLSELIIGLNSGHH